MALASKSNKPRQKTIQMIQMSLIKLYEARITLFKFQHSEFTVWTTRVSNPVCYPHFRLSTSVFTKESPSLLVFLYIFQDFTLTYKILLFCIKLK
jgi:hypothetical protein